jgi:hypothetical protein
MRKSKLPKEIQEVFYSEPENWREIIAHEPERGDTIYDFVIYLAACRYWRKIDPRGHLRGHPSTDLEIQEYWDERRKSRPVIKVCSVEYP